MITKRKILRAEQLCYAYSNSLTGALEVLASMASEVLGYEVVADICNGEEIEFRTVMDDSVANVANSDVAIRMEDIIEKLKA
jgi:hypothetical protein